MTTSEGEALRSRIVSGLAWKAGSQIVLQVSRLVVALILARLLAPHDWGVAAMVLVFSGFVIVFTDNALGTALIQRAEISERDRSTVFWVSAGVGLLLTLAGIAGAGPLAAFYGEPQVKPLFTVLSLSFLASSLGTTQTALLVREMRFRSLEIRQIAATTVAAACAIAVAVLGFGPWAIVTQQVVESAVSTTLLWRFTPWKPTLRFSTDSLRRLGGFAGNVFGQNLLYQVGRNLGNVLVARALGAAALGAYALASNVILVPFVRLAAPLQQVFFPAFSRMQGDRERMADMWIRVARLVGALSIPALAGMVIVAPDFVQVVLGERWQGATRVIQILAWAGLLQSLQTLNGEILLALDRSGTLLRFTMLWFAATVGSIAIGIQWGIVGVAWCYAIAITLIEPLNAFLAARALDVPLRRFAGAFVGIAQATAIMACVTAAARVMLVAADVPPAARLVLLIVLGVVVYIPCCLWRAPEVAQELARFRRRRPSPVAEPLPG